MLGPRKRPTSNHSRPPSSSPPAGSTIRVYAHQAGCHSGPVGTQNSRLAMVPPGFRDVVAYHLGPALPVLSEREEFSEPVVPRGEPVEQVPREAVGVVGHEGSPGAGAYLPQP